MGTAKLAGIDKDDIGKAAYGIFKGGDQNIGKTIAIAGEHLSFDEMSEKLSKGLGISPVKYSALDANLFRSFGFPGADEYGNMFQVYRDFEKEVNAVRSVEQTRALAGGSVSTFDQWLAKNKAAVLAAANPAPAATPA